jgi:hypothetical protein
METDGWTLMPTTPRLLGTQLSGGMLPGLDPPTHTAKKKSFTLICLDYKTALHFSLAFRCNKVILEIRHLRFSLFCPLHYFQFVFFFFFA